MDCMWTVCGLYVDSKYPANEIFDKFKPRWGNDMQYLVVYTTTLDTRYDTYTCGIV